MAKTDEEEYLDSLLKSMSMDESDNTTEKVNDTGINNSSEELDNFDTLSFDENNENNDNKEDSGEAAPIEDNDTESEDMDSRILNEMLLNDSNSIPDEEDDIQNDSINEANSGTDEPVQDSSEDIMDETSIDDMLKALQNNTYDSEDDSPESPDADSEQEPQAVTEQDNDELADILALDDGMTVDDIPDDISEEAVLTDEENRKVQDISSEDTVEAEKPAVKKEKIKKEKKKKEKPEKEKTEKADNTDKKEKKKFSIKNFFMKFDDEEDVAVNIEADNNQKLIDKFYGDKKSLDDADVEEDNSKKKKPKKEKKVKEKKPKKEKKEKKVFSKDDMQKVPFSRILVIILLSAIICVGVVVSSKIVNYKININNANDLYLSGNYSQAYEVLNGMDIKDKDKDFYEQARIMANLYQGISSYDNYIAIGDTTSALISLINAVSRKAALGDDILKYDFTDKVDNVYSKILSILNGYGISEETALDLGATDNYSELQKKVSSYGGTVK